MPISAQKINPCLWFDTEAEDAAKFYCSVFKNSRIGKVSHYVTRARRSTASRPGRSWPWSSSSTGQKFAALNGGPQFKFDEAISFQVHCKDQDEVDYFWKALSAGGKEGPCGWLKDKFGLSWQVVPQVLFDMLMDPDQNKSQRVTKAFLQMKKFDIAELQRAFAGRN